MQNDSLKIDEQLPGSLDKGIEEGPFLTVVFEEEYQDVFYDDYDSEIEKRRFLW